MSQRDLSRWFCVLALTAAVSPVGRSSAQTVIAHPDGTVSLHAVEEPLLRALGALAEAAPFARMTVDPAVTQRAVTARLDKVTVREAVVAVLEAAGVDYALSGGDGGPVRLIAQREASGRDLAAPGTAIDPVDVAAGLSLDIGGKNKEGEPTGQPDAVAADATRVQDAVREFAESRFADALTAPTVRAGPGQVVTLPFPGADGTPLTAVIPVGGSSSQLPFPGVQARTPQSAPASADPGLRELYQALVRPTGSRK